MSPAQVQRWLAVRGITLSVETIRRYCVAGVIACVTTPGGHHRVTLASLRTFARDLGLSEDATAA